jgi:hypothetical protein
VEEVDKRCSCCCGGGEKADLLCDHLLTLSTPHHQHRYHQRRKEKERKVPFITFFVVRMSSSLRLLGKLYAAS